MKQRHINTLRDFVPPVLLHAVRRLFRRDAGSVPENGKECNSAWYDRAFSEVEEYGRPYWESRYYYLWCVVVDRVLKTEAPSVLDIGCGPGQVASFFRDKGLVNYVGLDLSSVAIEKAQKLCPNYQFEAASAFDTDIFERVTYDTVVSMEFLEHVDDDLGVLKRIATGAKFVGTVPNFPYASHVRHFATCEEVTQRYGNLFRPFSVDVFISPLGSQKFFLIEGTKL